MRKTTMAAVVTAATAVTISVAASPAFASGPLIPQNWIIDNPNADGHYNASAGTTTLKDTATGTVLSCTSATAAGIFTNGTHTSGAGLGTITSTTYNGCAGPLGLHFTVAQSGTWLFNAVSYDPAGVTGGTISNISATLSGTGCSANVTGTVPVTFTNSNSQLTVNPTGTGLHVSNVSGCFSLINNNDVVTFDGRFILVPPIWIIDP